MRLYEEMDKPRLYSIDRKQTMRAETRSSALLSAHEVTNTTKQSQRDHSSEIVATHNFHGVIEVISAVCIGQLGVQYSTWWIKHDGTLMVVYIVKAH